MERYHFAKLYTQVASFWYFYLRIISFENHMDHLFGSRQRPVHHSFSISFSLQNTCQCAVARAQKASERACRQSQRCQASKSGNRRKRGRKAVPLTSCTSSQCYRTSPSHKHLVYQVVLSSSGITKDWLIYWLGNIAGIW
jgi:hypothetical protein